MSISKSFVGFLSWVPVVAFAQVEFTTLDAQLQPPSPRREMRAAWVATVSNIDWPTASNLSTATQQSQINAVLDTAKALNMNAVFVQMRTQCDALYSTTLAPWSKSLRGTMGVAPSPLYDPMQYWIAGAHQRGLEFHAWLNPYRALTGTGVGSSTHVTVTRPDLIITYNNAKYLDPGKVDSQTIFNNVVADIVTRYDVDGIVFDDYFYPYPDGVTSFPDSATYNAYTAAGGTLSLANWRRQNVDTMVLQIANTIKSIKPTCKYGIGPFGIWKPGNPAGVVGLSSYDEIYADTKKWINLGWLDYICPQLYWKISSTGQPYNSLTTWWTQQNLMNRHVYISNAAYKVADGTGTAWVSQEILDQINSTRNIAGATGNVFYNWTVMRNNRDTLRTQIQTGPYAQPALIPASTWLDNLAPFMPNLTYTFDRPTRIQHFDWSPQGIDTPHMYVVALLQNNVWTHKIYTATTLSYARGLKDGGEALQAFSVAAVDRMGNMSPWKSKVFDPAAININFDVESGSPTGVRTP